MTSLPPKDGHILMSLVADAGDVAFLMDTDRHLVWVSPACEEVLGWSPEELKGTQSADLLHPDDLVEAHAISRRLRTRESPGGQERDWLVRMAVKGGGYRWLSGSITRVDDRDGAAPRGSGVAVGAGIPLRQGHPSPALSL